MTRVWTFTTLVRVNTGPPTWWRPDIRLTVGRVTHVRLGWLRACIQVGGGFKRHHEEEES